MKIKLKNILLGLPLFAASAFAQADEQQDGLTYYPIHSDVFTFDMSRENKAHYGIHEYMIILADEPLAGYEGGVEGLSATNILASKSSNVTSRGMLDVNSLASKNYIHYLKSKQAETKLHISLRLKRELDIEFEFDTILNGFIAELNNVEAQIIANLPGIKVVEKLELQQLHGDSGPEFVGADNVWFGGEPEGLQGIAGSKGEGIVVGIIDTGVTSFLQEVEDINDDENLPEYHPSFAPFEKNRDGEVVYEFTNPLAHNSPNGQYFGDCVDQPNWCNEKLIGVVAIGRWAKDTVSWDEYDSRWYTGQDFSGHGTHVASTAAGNVVYDVSTEAEIGAMDHSYLNDLFPIAKDVGFDEKPREFIESVEYPQISGVAPRANIISYQICSSSSCTAGYAAVALEHAAKVGVNVINYSIGGGYKSPWYNWNALSFLNARKANIHVAIAAGNLGGSGWSTVTAPANAPWVMSVGSNTHDRGFSTKIATFTGGDAENPIKNVDKKDEQFDGLEGILRGDGASKGLAATAMVLATTVEFDDASDIWQTSGSCAPDTLKFAKVEGKVVICNRGGQKGDSVVTRVAKGFEVKRAGGLGMILINTKDTADNIEADRHLLPTIHLTRKNGKALLTWLKSGEDHLVAIADTVLIKDEDKAYYPSFFSSRGPDVFSKDYLIPSINAPGDQILAAGLGDGLMNYAPKAYTSYQDFVYKSGTSMASPMVAGIFALIEGAKLTAAEEDKWTPAETQSAVMLTADQNIKVWQGEYDNDDNRIRKPADFHIQGSGMARADLAINSGFVMPMSHQDYLDADPYADNPAMLLNPDNTGWPEDEDLGLIEDADLPYLVDPYGDKAVAETWHGKTHRMNLASLSRGDCKRKCGWIRTFKATRDDFYNISYSYNNEGWFLKAYFVDETVDDLELNPRKEDEVDTVEMAGSEISTLAVTKGETYRLYFVAENDEILENSWANGRVHFKSANAEMPEMTLAAAIEFVAGTIPEEVNIVAHRDTGKVQIKDIVTVGADDFTIYESEIADSDTQQVYAYRDSTPYKLFNDYDEGTFIYPMYIPADTLRLVIEIDETSSPDVDLYLAIDYNANGEVETNEVYNMPYADLSAGAKAKIDISSPMSGVYNLMIHNFGDIFNAEQIEQGKPNDKFDPDTLTEEDMIKFTVSLVRAPKEGNSASLKAIHPFEAEKDEEIRFDLKWDKAMDENQRYFGQLILGTKEELLGNLGRMDVNILRAEDAVELAFIGDNPATSEASYQIKFVGNDTDDDVTYHVSIDLTDGTSLVSLTHENVNPALSTKSAGEVVDFEQERNTLTFEHTVTANSTATAMSIMIDYNLIEGFTDMSPVVMTAIVEDETPTYSYAKNCVNSIAVNTCEVIGRPLFSALASIRNPEKGEEVTLTATLVDAVIANANISYNWTQVSGPKVDVIGAGREIKFITPGSKDESTIVFELVGHNGDKPSNPVEVYVNVEASEAGSSIGWMWLIFAATFVNLRRKYK